MKLNKITKISDLILKSYNKEGFFFIQIGVHQGKDMPPQPDGKIVETFDLVYKFINKYNWQNGILIEPVKEIYGNLLKTYENYKGLIFENVAIAEKKGQKNILNLLNGLKNISQNFIGP